MSSSKSHKGCYSAPACGPCPSGPAAVTLRWLRVVLAPLGTRALVFAVEQSFVLWVGGVAARPEPQGSEGARPTQQRARLLPGSITGWELRPPAR